MLNLSIQQAQIWRFQYRSSLPPNTLQQIAIKVSTYLTREASLSELTRIRQVPSAHRLLRSNILSITDLLLQSKQGIYQTLDYLDLGPIQKRYSDFNQFLDLMAFLIDMMATLYLSVSLDHFPLNIDKHLRAMQECLTILLTQDASVSIPNRNEKRSSSRLSNYRPIIKLVFDPTFSKHNIH